MYSKVLYRGYYPIYKWVVKSWSSFSTREETDLNLDVSPRFFKHFFKESLNIFILKLYTNGFTMEFAMCKAPINRRNVGEKHWEQNSLMPYTMKPGSHKVSDTATTM